MGRRAVALSLAVLIAAVVVILLTAAARWRTPDVRLVATGQIDGQLTGCDCGDGSVAGLVKIVDTLRSVGDVDAPVLLVDTGNFTSASDEPEHNRAMLEIANDVGYDAIALGDQEFSEGFDAALEYVARFPIGSENVTVREESGTNARTQHSLRGEPADGTADKQGDPSVDVIPLTSAKTFERYPEEIRDAVSIVDPITFVQKRGDREEDLSVVVLHGTYAEAQALAAAAPWVDVIVYGRWSEAGVERASGGTWLVSPGSDGNVVDVIDLRRRRGAWDARIETVAVNYFDDPDDAAAASRAAMFGVCRD